MRLSVGTAAVAGCLLATPIFAQSDDDFMNSDAMEAQRCIWRCQSNNPSMGKRYQQCIDAQCNGEPQARPSEPRRQPTSGRSRANV